jgi:hypothetical protein
MSENINLTLLENDYKVKRNIQNSALIFCLHVTGSSTYSLSNIKNRIVIQMLGAFRLVEFLQVLSKPPEHCHSHKRRSLSYTKFQFYYYPAINLFF